MFGKSIIKAQNLNIFGSQFYLINPKFVLHSISWTHIDDMISEAGLKRTFDSYFIDYAFMNDVSEAGHHRVFHSSAISTTKHSVEIEDDCLVYSVVLGVVIFWLKFGQC